MRLAIATGTLALAAGLCGSPAQAQEQASVTQDLPGRQEPARNGAPTPWMGVITDSLRLLAIEHSYRLILQTKTRRELAGPFFGDYRRSLRMPTTWSDGDSWNVNYVGHAIHGAAAGFLWLTHEAGGTTHPPGLSKQYWASRSRSMAWATAYSLQFEFGPLSEASIGNVGLRPENTGWVDHVVTPLGALGFVVAEDMLDHHLIERIERQSSNRVVRGFARTLLNPSRTLSNAAQGRAPWFRSRRPAL